MQDISGNIISKWSGDFNRIQSNILNGRRTVQQAKIFMEKEYIDPSITKAFKYLMYVHPQDSILERRFYSLICDAVKLGFGKDLNFENVFR